VVFSPAITGDFVWDDDLWVTKNPQLKTAEGLYNIWFVPGSVVQYYPLTYTSWWLDHKLWGLNPVPYRLENILLHALCAFLLYLILARLLIPGAFIAALIFVAHPVNVESVAWITERKNVLAGVFYLSSALAYLRYCEEQRKKLYWGAMGLFVLALLSKTAVVALPAVLLAICWLKDAKWQWKWVLRVLPFAAVATAMACVTIATERAEGAAGSEFSATAVERVALAGQVFWFYLGKLLLPINLSFVYHKWDIGASRIAAFLPLAAVGILFAAGIGKRASWGRFVLIGVGYFAAAITPVAGFFDVYYMRYAYVADHFAYFAAMGLIPFVVAVCDKLLRGAVPKLVPQAKVGLGWAVVLLCGVLSAQQAATFKDAETLWRATLRRSPDAWLARASLGGILIRSHREEEGLAELKLAQKLAPHSIEPLLLQAEGYQMLGDGTKARELLEEAKRMNPGDYRPHNALGVLFIQSGNYGRAISAFKQGLLASPHNREISGNLAMLLATCPDPAFLNPTEALDLALEVCAQPGGRTAINLYTLAAAYVASKRPQEAIAAAEEGLVKARAENDQSLVARLEAGLASLGR
jgi:tetratricopeptide (TPR) repeat protein